MTTVADGKGLGVEGVGNRFPGFWVASGEKRDRKRFLTPSSLALAPATPSPSPAGENMPLEAIPTILAAAFLGICAVASEILVARRRNLSRHMGR
jgi:hypothetical protein